jgi:AcrR family transcriptional regulator
MYPVPEEQGKDRRVQKTQRLLRDALVSLIHEKSYDSIVVKEILERANVGRSAFYAHFHDKDALLASGIHEILHAVSRRRLPSSANRFEKAVWFSLPVFEHVDQFRHTAHAEMDGRGRAVVHEHLRQVLIEHIADDVRTQVQHQDARAGAIPPDLLVEYVVVTFILVLNWWVESNSRLSPREADDVFLSMVLPTLVAAVDGQ